MRGGLERWKRGVESQGVRQALAYAFQGSCDSHVRTGAVGIDALAAYGDADSGVTRFTVEAGETSRDRLNEQQLRLWVDGHDPLTGEQRGRDLKSADADLLLDGTINAPKSYSVAALINEDLAHEFEALQDRLRDRIISTWQQELNARRGAGGRIRESLHRVEVVELKHRRSRALDPHIHRHLWLNVRVQGEDGKWSNVDSRVAMKLHTVINAEGELAARTDPEWIAALARNGYTLDESGEIAELALAVRPLSRRSNQIERNRAVLLAQWPNDHPHQEPSPDILQQIDRLAWATGRPGKPANLDEADWEDLIRDELLAIGPRLADSRPPVAAPQRALAALDLDLLAARAIVEADARSTACGGRFSQFDIRAGATRALAATGVVEHRGDMQRTLDDIIARASTHVVDLLAEHAVRPDHVKGYMAASTAALKVDLAARFDALSAPGDRVADALVDRIATEVLAEGLELDDPQKDAAAAIAGTDRLVSITGPAGAGKTTMLRVAKAAIAVRGARMLVVAPTKKAATVAGREIGATASSLHALLSDHGWRWERDEAGAEHWRQLRAGEMDAATGRIYDGPRRFILSPGDRIVVDEAGMVDLHAAHALAIVASETGAGIAMVGDHLQAMPVGHSGAMASLTRRATAVVELTAVHRFRDPEYAALTLRMREPDSKGAALEVAAELDQRDLIHRVDDSGQARDVMVEAYFRWAGRRQRIALVTSTNEEADAINEAIQQRRLEAGQLTLTRIALGQGEQRILEDDLVQTRKNDRGTGVENRALWSVHRITPDGVELAALTGAGDIRLVSHEYAAEHLHLAYASTVHGIQGETTDASVVGPGVDASGLYVGMTRGRVHNEAIAIAHTHRAARDAIAESMLRGIPEVSIDDSIRAARSELGRAAQLPVVGPTTAAWTDLSRRPHGRVTDLERLVAVTRGRHDALRDQTERAVGWLDRAGRALLHAAARDANARTALHGRRVADTELDDTSAQLAERVELRAPEVATLARDLTVLTAQLEELEAEQMARRRLDPNARAYEERARASLDQSAGQHMPTLSRGLGI